MSVLPDDVIYVIIGNDGPELGLTCRKYYQLLLSLRHYLINTYNYIDSYQQDDGSTVKKYRTYGKKIIYHSIIYRDFSSYTDKYDRISGLRISVTRVKDV